jgi:uncharacterized membrane protein YfcA
MVDSFIRLLLSTGVNDFVATHDWVWPVCEILHFFGMALLIGSLLGGYLGAHWSIVKGNLWIKRVFEVVTVLVGLKLIA